MGLFDWLLGRKPQKRRPSGGVGSLWHTVATTDLYTPTTYNGNTDPHTHHADRAAPPVAADSPADTHHHSHHAPATQPSDFSPADHHSSHDPGPASFDSSFDAGGGHHH